jgi:hypothetical protein
VWRYAAVTREDMSTALQHGNKPTKGVLRISRVNEDIRFAGTHVVSIDGVVSERANQLILQGD